MDEIICTKANYCNPWGKYFYIILLTIPALPICWVDSYTNMSYFSITGIAVAIVGMISITAYCSTKLANHTSNPDPLKVFDVAGFFGHIGVAMFVFEGNAVILNVRAETKR